MPAQRKTAKFAVVVLFIFTAFLVIIGKTFSVQIIQGSYFKERAKNQHETTKTMKARRGSFVDRNGKLLVTSTQLYTVAADPHMLTDTMRLCQILAERTDTTAEYYLNKIQQCKTRYIELARELSESKIAAVRAMDDRGVLEIPHPKRKYIHGKTAAQLIGLTDIEDNGIGGLELKYNDYLKGKDGLLFCRRDALGNLYLSPALKPVPAEHGNTLQLTIDVDLQKIVEYELANGVNYFDARSGTVIAVEPKTGEVLAMSTYPDFDPDDRSTATNDRLRNRAITDRYEPGSTFKMITAAAAFEEGLIAEDDTVDAEGGKFMIYGHGIVDTHEEGKMTFAEAVEISSNVVFAKLAAQIEESGGASKFYKYIRDFGFGLATGIDMLGEISGNLPKPKEFSGVSPYYIGHGYGIDVTPIQLIMAYAAVANDGILMKPKLVKEIRSPEGKVIKEFRPEMIRKPVSEENARRLRKLFTCVVDRGTGLPAKIEGISIAGKTGTSKQLDSTGRYRGFNYNASFVGMYPADEPEIVILVLIDRPKRYYYGGPVAGSIFRNIASRHLSSNLDIAQRKYVLDSILTLNKEYIPDLKTPPVIGMKTQNAKKYLEEMDYRFSTENEGIIRNQNPIPFATLTSNKKKIEAAAYSNEIGLEKSRAGRVKPDVDGLPLRQAVAALTAAGYKFQITGSGSVVSQRWKTNVHNEEECVLKCR